MTGVLSDDKLAKQESSRIAAYFHFSRFCKLPINVFRKNLNDLSYIAHSLRDKLVKFYFAFCSLKEDVFRLKNKHIKIPIK